MVANIERLKGKIIEHNLTQKDIAKKMGIDKSTFSRKLSNNGKGFTVEEIHKMVDIIPLSKEEAVDIFFNQ